MSISKPTARKSDIVMQEIDGETLIYDLISNKAFNLNHTSAMVWTLCDGTRTAADIAKNMSGRLDSVVNEDFVWLALEQLKKDNLLEDSTEIIVPFEGLSRREVIRKVGLASLVALPVVASLVAPTAVQAQSCGATNKANGCACTQQGQCASGCCSSTPRTCVSPGTKTQGTPCIANCECATGLTCKGSPQTCQP